MINKKTNLILLFLAFITFGYFLFAFSFVSVPGDPLYFTKHQLQNIQIKNSESDKEKATKRLSIITSLVHKFDMLAHKNANDSHLVSIADEIIYQSKAVTVDLTRMKDAGGDVKKEAEILCEALEKQVHTLKYLTGIANPNLQKALGRISVITQKYVDQAMEWE